MIETPTTSKCIRIQASRSNKTIEKEKLTTDILWRPDSLLNANLYWDIIKTSHKTLNANYSGIQNIWKKVQQFNSQQHAIRPHHYSVGMLVRTRDTRVWSRMALKRPSYASFCWRESSCLQIFKSASSLQSKRPWRHEAAKNPQLDWLAMGHSDNKHWHWLDPSMELNPTEVPLDRQPRTRNEPEKDPVWRECSPENRRGRKDHCEILILRSYTYRMSSRNRVDTCGGAMAVPPSEYVGKTPQCASKVLTNSETSCYRKQKKKRAPKRMRLCLVWHGMETKTIAHRLWFFWKSFVIFFPLGIAMTKRKHPARYALILGLRPFDRKDAKMLLCVDDKHHFGDPALYFFMLDATGNKTREKRVNTVRLYRGITKRKKPLKN